MSEAPAEGEWALRPGELAVAPPSRPDAGVFFIGIIHTPWHSRRDCPRRGDPADGPICTIEIEERWRPALTGLASHPRLQILYWMHQARRDLVLQAPVHLGRVTGTFALRSPVRPNPIASSIVVLVGVEGGIVRVRGLDCLDGTPLIDLKPAPAG